MLKKKLKNHCSLFLSRALMNDHPVLKRTQIIAANKNFASRSFKLRTLKHKL